MDRNADLIDLLHALNAEGAEYLIVGGYAFALHGKPRATKDVDIFIGTDTENASRVWRALQSFGAPLENAANPTRSTSLPRSTASHFKKPGRIALLRGMGMKPQAVHRIWPTLHTFRP